MKRLNALLLCAALLFSLAACGGDTGGGGDVLPPEENALPKPYDAYRTACEALASTNGVYCMETRTLVSLGNATLDIHQTYRTNGSTYDLYSFYSNLTETQIVQYRYTAGTAFITLNEKKAKCAMTADDFCDRFLPERIADPGLLGFTSLQFYGIHTVPEIGGYYFTLHAEANKNAAAFLRGALGESAFALYEKATIGTITYRIHFTEDGNLRSVMTEFDMLSDGNLLSVSAATSYTHIGEGEKVDLPADAAAFSAVTLDQLPKKKGA